MKLLVGGGRSNVGRAMFETKRVRSHDPLSHDDREGSVANNSGSTSELQYLHADLIKGFSNSMNGIIMKRHFWNSLFSAVVQADRKYMGWNEKTIELYDR